MLIVPLGGCGEFGRNATAYLAGRQVVFADFGLELPDERAPGVDCLISDVRAFVERFGLPTAVVLTHGHEDHIGGVGYLLRLFERKIPIYGRRLTLALCERRLDRTGVPRRLIDFRPLEPGQPLVFGDEEVREPRLEVTPLAVPHSIPEACALLIRERVGAEIRATALHTGDYKLDAEAPNWLPASLGQSESERVDVVVGDSTNAMVEGAAGPESRVGEALDRLLHDPRTTGRVAVALFSSHVERMAAFAQSCERAGRRLCLLGRGVREVAQAAERTHVLRFPVGLLVSPEEAARLPARELALLCTGAQGEPESALGKLAFALTPENPSAFGALRLESGDTVVLSARTIPGQERVVGRLIDRLLVAGIAVLPGGAYTVSGHGCRDELLALLNRLRPRALIPVHGTLRQIYAHAALAESLGLESLRPRDGMVITVTPSELAVIDHVPVEPLFAEGSTLGEVGAATLRVRKRIQSTGVVIAAVHPDSGEVPRIHVRSLGITDPGASLVELEQSAALAGTAALREFERANPGEPLGNAEQSVARAVRSVFTHRRGIKPTVLAMLGSAEVRYDDLGK